MLNQKLMGKTGEDKQFIEDLFAVHLYTGNGSTQTINNGIDLAGKGGMVWTKVRNQPYNHYLFDSARASFGNYLRSDTVNGESAGGASYLASVSNTGYTLGATAAMNGSGNTYASWTFRKAPKFFDVVTYTGNGAAQNIAHYLGQAPGMMVVKKTNGTGNWVTYHQTQPSGYFYLDTTNALVPGAAALVFGNDSTVIAPTSSVFSVGSIMSEVGATYVAYLFAHDTTTDGLIQCGSYTTNASAVGSVNLGWEPQYVIAKSVTSASDWLVQDVMRGQSQTTNQMLLANNSGAEYAQGSSGLIPNATGFTDTGNIGANATVIYMAIRRGPMKTPTDGTKVFAPGVAGTTNTPAFTTSFPPDLIFTKYPGGGGWQWQDRLRGKTQLYSESTSSESPSSQDLYQNGAFASYWGGYYGWLFKRAPGFFDVVCYTGTGVARTVNHNLGVAPELMIVKGRSYAGSWIVYANPVGNTKALLLNTTDSPIASGWWNNTSPTASVFSLGGTNDTNSSGSTFVAYLFASCPGVSKVGSYTGNGSSQTINCGFTNGARFFLVKATSTTGSWWVYDSARGIVAAADPALQLNSTAAEVTSADAVDPDSTGIIVNQEATCSINASGVSYIYLAIA